MIEGTTVRLRGKRLADAPVDYAWKTDAELAYLDGASPLGIPFSRYLSSYAEELRYTSVRRRCFAIETLDGKHIGNCMYYNVDEDRVEAELGILIGNRDYWDKGYGSDVVTALITQIFKETNLKRVYLHTLDGNMRAQRCFQKCGFLPCGRVTRDGRNFIIMEIRKADWLASTEKRTLQHSG